MNEIQEIKDWLITARKSESHIEYEKALDFIEFLLFHVSTLEKKVKELEESQILEAQRGDYWIKKCDKAEFQIKELEIDDKSRSEKFMEIGNKYESLKFKVFDLEARLEHYKSHYEATLANWNITLDRLKNLQEAVEKVLADEESTLGGWGPDVTCVGILREALERR